jgi:peptide deformylase
MATIVQSDNPVLRKVAQEVPISEINSSKIQNVIKEMADLLATQDDGVAIAAPQIGHSLRIFLVSDEVMRMADPKYKGGKNLVFINPTITKLSREKHEVEEGCLSVRWKYGKVKRAKKATVKAYDEEGNLFERGASGLLAQVFQHECDHLDGILFIDSATDIHDLPPEEQARLREVEVEHGDHHDHDYADA